MLVLDRPIFLNSMKIITRMHRLMKCNIIIFVYGEEICFISIFENGSHAADVPIKPNMKYAVRNQRARVRASNNRITAIRPHSHPIILPRLVRIIIGCLWVVMALMS